MGGRRRQDSRQHGEADDYDVILMDWHMDKMSGIDAVKAIRTKGKTMPIIMVTTEAGKDHVVKALTAGATDDVIKPFKPATVVAKINEALRQSG